MRMLVSNVKPLVNPRLIAATRQFSSARKLFFFFRGVISSGLCHSVLEEPYQRINLCNSQFVVFLTQCSIEREKKSHGHALY